MIRRIRDLLYDQGFTISGARNKLHEIVQIEGDKRRNGEVMLDGFEVVDVTDSISADFADSVDFEESELLSDDTELSLGSIAQQRLQLVRRELYEIRDLLNAAH